jgi:hypothetical protein
MSIISIFSFFYAHRRTQNMDSNSKAWVESWDSKKTFFALESIEFPHTCFMSILESRQSRKQKGERESINIHRRHSRSSSISRVFEVNSLYSLFSILIAPEILCVYNNSRKKKIHTTILTFLSSSRFLSPFPYRVLFFFSLSSALPNMRTH